MYRSIFTDELALDLAAALPILQSWGLKSVDLRGRVLGKACEALDRQELLEVKALVKNHGMTVGCLESSLAKVHLPDAARQQAELEKLERLIIAAEVLDCKLIRSFFYWQPKDELRGELAVRPDEQQKVQDAFAPLAARAKAAGLTLAFENCGVTPEEVLTMLDRFGVPHWGLAWDVANSWNNERQQREGEAYLKALALRSRLVHVKAKGAVAEAGGELIPWSKVLQICDNAGLRGPVSIETHNPNRGMSNADMSRLVHDAIRKAWPSAAPAGLFDAPKATDKVVRTWHDRPVGFVVAGLGMGHNRAKMVTQTSGCKLLGVCDLVAERAKRTSDECGVPGTTDLQPWLDDPKVEVVWVMTETGRHAEVALRALAAGKHVLTTKPMEASLAACDTMIATAKAKGRLLGVDFDRRYRPDLLSLRDTLKQGHLGRLVSTTCSLKILRNMDYFRSNGGWRGTRRWDGGGVLSNQSIHHIDELVCCLGVPAKVRCNLWTQAHEIEAEDLGCATWVYADGSVATFMATTNYPHATWYFQQEVVGSKGIYFTAAGGPFDKPVVKWYLNNAWGAEAPVQSDSPWLNSADNMAGALRSDATLVCPGEEGRRSQAVLDAMYRSHYEANGDFVTPIPAP